MKGLPEKTWFQEAAELVVRQSLPFRQAVVELGLDMTGVECDRIFRSKPFQEVLRAERHKFNTEVANDPGRTKTSLIGLASMLIQKLIEEGQYDKALDGIQKLAKLEGWDKSGEINIFAGVTALDIANERARLEKQALIDAS